MNKKVLFYLIMTALCFGTLEISGKIAGNNLDPYQFTFWRFLIGPTFILPIAIGEQRERRKNAAKAGIPLQRITARDILIIIAAGAICVPLSMGIAQAGIIRSNAATAAVILGTNGMFSMVSAHFLAGERMTKSKVGYLFIALLGLLFMICPWDMQPGNTLAGALMVLFGAMLFGLYTVIGKFAGKRIGSITQAVGSLYAGAILQLIFILITDRPLFVGLSDNLPVMFYAGIVVTGGGYLFMFLTIKHAGVQTSAISFFLKIAIAPLLSVIVLRESLTWNCFLGIGLVLVASYLNLRTSSGTIVPPSPQGEG
jgi:drug/metabolite transporter (DMT)-like permease